MDPGAAAFSEVDWFDGQKLTGFTRDHLIGRGSTGAVFLLRNSIDELAVVKELDVGRMSPKERQQAAQEVRLLSELSHPNIIAYYGTVFHKRRQVLEIYMEYAECGTLADVILERQCRHDAKGIEEQTVMRWTRQMISALRCVHKRKIIHRDLKPSNVFVTKDGTIKLADFGISAELSNTEQKAETVCGTPYYLSPEMVSGKPYSTATDVWSLGCILWEVLTLQRPFSGSNIMQLAMQIMSKELDVSILETRAPDVDRRLRTMVAQMLAKDPAQRPTVQQLHDDPFLSERLGMLYLRHISSNATAGGGARLGGGSSSPSRPSSSLSAREPCSDRVHAARAMQAGVRGWRDRQVVRFLRSIAGPDERLGTPTTSAQQAALRVHCVRGPRAPMFSPHAALASSAAGGLAGAVGLADAAGAANALSAGATPRGTPRGPITLSKCHPPSSVVPLPAVACTPGGAGACGLFSSTSLPTLNAAGGSSSSSPPTSGTPSGRFSPLQLSHGGSGGAVRSPGSAGFRRVLRTSASGGRCTASSPLSVGGCWSAHASAAASPTHSPQLAVARQRLSSAPASPSGTLLTGIFPLPLSHHSTDASDDSHAPSPAGAAEEIGAAAAPGARCASSAPARRGAAPDLHSARPLTSIGALRVRDAEATHKRTSVRLRPELRGELERHSSPLRAATSSVEPASLSPPKPAATAAFNKTR